MNQRLIELNQQQDAIMLKICKTSFSVETDLFTQLTKVLLEKKNIHKQKLELLKNDKA